VLAILLGDLEGGSPRLGRALLNARIRCPHLDPFHKQVDLLGRQLARGRHLVRLVLDGRDQQAFVGFAGHDHRTAFAAGEHGLPGIERQTGLQLALAFGLGRVALITVLDQ